MSLMCLINTVALLGLYFREIPVILHTVGLYMKEETSIVKRVIGTRKAVGIDFLFGAFMPMFILNLDHV